MDGISHGMRKFGIEDETWFESARIGLEQRGFTIRLQPRSIIIDKEGRLPRILGSARDFLEFAERQGLTVTVSSYEGADQYGNEHSDLRGRASVSQFESPAQPVASAPSFEHDEVAPAEQRREMSPVELRLAELRLEQDRLTAERCAAHALAQDKQQLEQRCRELEAELQRLTVSAAEAVKSRDLWQMSAEAAEGRLRLLEAESEMPGRSSADKRFDQLRRFLARELHPDLAGEDTAERSVREALFKRVWAKIETLQ